MTHIRRFPAPRGLPLIGNLHQFPRGRFMQHLIEVGRGLGGIFEMDFAGRRAVFVSAADLVAELSDETRFRKMLGPALYYLRDAAGDGLFTAYSDEPNWGRAHRVLMPAFSQRAMRSYFAPMLEVAQQLVAAWSADPGADHAVADDMTRLTLDTISLAGFGYRFNSFAAPELHPFLAAMARVLQEAMDKLTRLPIQRKFQPRGRARRYAADIARMNALVDEVIRERRLHPSEAPDLLNLMLASPDPETGTTLDDLNIRNQVITFLIAGHETTSGLLTFALHLLLRNPHVLAQAYAEVDQVLPVDTVPEYPHLARLTVIDRVLKETLRLWPTAPAYVVGPYEDTVIGGRYALPKDQFVTVLIPCLHRDPAVWTDPDDFDIDRWLPEAEAKLHPHAYKPFGNGARACIGRQFALAEARLALALLLQNFVLHDPYEYRLSVKETLTLKPDRFRLRVRKRHPHERLRAAPTHAAAPPETARPVEGAGRTLAIRYGTSLGTCREIAERIAAQAEGGGFKVDTAPLDALAGDLPAAGILVVITATYNGRAPDNAARLEAALEAGGFEKRPQLAYALLGCGNTQWQTYQAFPKRVEAALAATGARPLLPRAEADANGDFDGAVERWLAELWTALGEGPPAAATPALAITYADAQATRRVVLPEAAMLLEVLRNDELVRDPAGLWDFSQEAPRGSTRHLELRLPAGAAYRTGDHFAVYPRNRPELVDGVVARLGLLPDTVVVLQAQGGRTRHLPLGTPLTIRQLLSDFIELQDIVARADLRRLAVTVACPVTRAQIEALAGELYQAEIVDRRVTLPDLLERFPALTPGLETLLESAAAARPRFYSISSAAEATPEELSLTVGTLAAPSWSGNGLYHGVASSYLRDLRPGDRLLGFVRTPNPPFAPPEDAGTPMILVGPGTGIAPFRGFLQARAAARARGAAMGPTLLFYGCRHPQHDWLYRDEMEGWARDGIATLHLAFSALPGHPDRFVQDALRRAGAAVHALLEEGAPIYVCGDGRFMAPAVRDALIDLRMQARGTGRDEASLWLEALIARGSYRQDVFNG